MWSLKIFLVFSFLCLTSGTFFDRNPDPAREVRQRRCPRLRQVTLTGGGRVSGCRSTPGNFSRRGTKDGGRGRFVRHIRPSVVTETVYWCLRIFTVLVSQNFHKKFYTFVILQFQLLDFQFSRFRRQPLHIEPTHLFLSGCTTCTKEG